ncbi:MAG TPA: nickel-binding protein [Vitreimonas sp.]|nr:nickel-binding protein [Vitreimonas sp.]
MPTYMDIHELPGVTPEAVAEAHLQDMKVQSKYGVTYHKYWINQRKGKIYCFCEAPSAEAADAVHREAHGLPAARIMEVLPEMAEAFMGTAETNLDGAVVLPQSTSHDPGTRTIFFTDIVGSTALTQKVGDDGILALLEIHDRIVRDALSANRGAEVKHTGDGIMASFISANSAVRCGMDVIKNIADVRDESAPLRVRIGIASGEPIERANDLFGATVQLAARLCQHAEPEQILISNAVAELCVGKMLPIREIGRLALKGFDDPVHAHAVAMR